jgi:tRNA1Val (adenine37-N6)-methyltransferase
MGNSWFQFQQFRIHQDRCAMKISTDAVLLGTLAGALNPKSILDIGTGTGVIAMMLAQRFPEARIQAVEIDEEAAFQALENFQGSKFSERMKLYQGRFQGFQSSDLFDLIVSNPPYFPDHLKSKDPKRVKALHTDELSFEDLIKKVVQVLNTEGSFWIILPQRQMRDFRQTAEKFSLYLNQTIQVKDKVTSPVLREVCRFSFAALEEPEKPLVLKESDNAYTQAYQDLLSGFLLGY